MAKEKKAPYKKVVGQSAGGASLAAIIAFLWNGYIREPAMTAEVAGALGGLVGPLVAYLASWAPHPENGAGQ